jgi:hypothetical protein
MIQNPSSNLLDFFYFVVTCLHSTNIDTQIRFLNVTVTLPCAFLCQIYVGLQITSYQGYKLHRVESLF